LEKVFRMIKRLWNQVLIALDHGKTLGGLSINY
jgi:hypothetical protein